MTWHTKRLLKRLVTCEFPADQGEVARKQIEDIVAYHIASFSPTKDIDEQMKACAFDCYVQGLLDGAQVAKVMPGNGDGAINAGSGNGADRKSDLPPPIAFASTGTKR